jgi:hypothetical protein
MEKKALAIANNDLIYLWWTYSEEIRDCLGFSVRRYQAGKPPVALPAFVGFQPKAMQAAPTKPRMTTDDWPIQSYQWKDLFVPEETPVIYEIVPMKGVPGKPLQPMPELAVRTGEVCATDRLGSHRVVFNRGIISTQALAKRLPKDKSGTPSANALGDPEALFPRQRPAAPAGGRERRRTTAHLAPAGGVVGRLRAGGNHPACGRRRGGSVFLGRSQPGRVGLVTREGRPAARV